MLLFGLDHWLCQKQHVEPQHFAHCKLIIVINSY